MFRVRAVAVAVAVVVCTWYGGPILLFHIDYFISRDVGTHFPLKTRLRTYWSGAEWLDSR